MERNRLYYLDNLKILLAISIVTVHVALAYAPDIWWFFKDETENTSLFVYYQLINPIAMTLFFLLAAYFLPYSFDRKGISKFLKERFKRIGLPFLLGVFLVIIPLHFFYHVQFRNCGYENIWDYTVTIFFGIGGEQGICQDRWLTVWPDLKVAHFWFLQHLLIYAVFYAFFRYIQQKYSFSLTQKKLSPKSNHILFLIGLLSILTFILRIWYPLDYWDGFLGAIQIEYANWPKYFIFFLVGLIAFRMNWLQKFPTRSGFQWLLCGVILLVCSFVFDDYFSVVLTPGGFNLASMIWSVWDCTMTTSLCIGLIVLFRETLNGTGRLIRWLSANTYGVYIFHVPIVAIIQFLLIQLPVPIFVKVSIEMILGILFSFAFSFAIRQSRWVRKVI
ncbi:acyltransferase family protein [Alkalihalobacillus hemicellulosilyticus]|uniref:Acyltransferase 3 domain-containing protein n=1 Tax=Halalkalibacter hemicellulosilyticusJCM 9152 TaxID=1236971 RepID=W4QMQ6_9BACI|nr:acyltransferase family protein [Halalkalibacter hemicellulosilyticus]GAE32629.1 hypothetical protein JCM9152_4172 [Halalkalibacter hemicellulosilyticusJCM 9152]